MPLPAPKERAARATWESDPQGAGCGRAGVQGASETGFLPLTQLRFPLDPPDLPKPPQTAMNAAGNFLALLKMETLNINDGILQIRAEGDQGLNFKSPHSSSTAK